MSDGAARWQRLEEIVQSALERPVEERGAFIAAACGGDEELRREAASLVDRDAHADAFLAAPLAELAADAVTYSPGSSPEGHDARDPIGARLGVYEIQSRIGAGGMGEVYRAHDHALGRDVAIKVLPAAFAADADRLARFEREARLLASLNHPHIGAVYGLAGDGTLRGIVLELIDGDTLEARLKRGPLPATQALALAVQIAHALEHAHRRGVMHRDLKPANIMLTKGGVKLLDFGLAKWGRQRPGYVDASGSAGAGRPPGAETLTSEGTILGTVHYMAPEQLEGKKVDARADVFAFGAVLYEMLAGQRAFDGGSTAAVMAAVLNSQPAALDTVARPVAPALERVIRKCLAKSPDERWQTMRDLADELEWIAEEAGRPAAATGAPRARQPRLNRWLTTGAVAAGLALAGWAGWRIGSESEAPAPRAIVRFPIQPSTGARPGGFDISADGTRVVYASLNRLYLRQLNQPTDALISGTEGGNAPVFSPDSQWIAFISQGRLMKVGVEAGATPILLWEGGRRWLSNNMVWLEDGTIVIGRPENGLVRVRAEGGEPEELTALAGTPQEFDHHSPSALPGGEALLFTAHEPSGFKVVAEVLATKQRKVLIESAFDAHYVSTGHLVFAKAGAILAVPFDVRRLEVTGPPVVLVDDVVDGSLDGLGNYRVAKNGTLVYLPSASRNGRTLVWVDRKGAETPLSIAPRAFSDPRLSPNGKRAAFTVREGGRRDIWLYTLETGQLTRLTAEGDNFAPLWTHDGQRLVYTSTRSGAPALLWQPVDGGGAVEPIVSGDVDLAAGAWSRDGTVLLYTDGGTNPDGTSLYSVSVDGDRRPTPLVHGPGEQWGPSVSPDGKWVAYTSSHTGRPEVYAADYPNFTTRQQVSFEGGTDSQWSGDGQEIVYRSGVRLFSVSLNSTGRSVAGKPREWPLGRYAFQPAMSYAIARDGRLLMIKPDPEELVTQGLRVVLNWTDELARRVPTGQ